jgi:Molybdopterin converting factor, small subunit
VPEPGQRGGRLSARLEGQGLGPCGVGLRGFNGGKSRRTDPTPRTTSLIWLTARWASAAIFIKDDKDVNLVKITVKIFGPKYFGLDTYDVITTVLEVRDGATVAEVMDALDRIYHGLKNKLLRNGVIIPMHDMWINSRSIDFLQGLDTVLKEGDVVQIIPPFGG